MRSPRYDLDKCLTAVEHLRSAREDIKLIPQASSIAIELHTMIEQLRGIAATYALELMEQERKNVAAKG